MNRRRYTVTHQKRPRPDLPTFLMVSRLTVALLALVLTFIPVSYALSLTSRAVIRNRSVDDLRTVLATPNGGDGWSSILSPSFGSVTQADPFTSKSIVNPVDRPLQRGERVKEVFGFSPPILPLSVTWTCLKNEEEKKGGHSLEYFTEDGLPGVSKKCRMSFHIRRDEDNNYDDATTVEMTVEIDPVTPLQLCLYAVFYSSRFQL